MGRVTWIAHVAAVTALTGAAFATATVDAMAARVDDRSVPATGPIVVRAGDLPGYAVFGPIVDLDTDSYIACMHGNRLLASVPSPGPAGTGVPESDRDATLGTSFVNGAVATGEERDVASMAWAGTDLRQARAAFDALASGRYARCVRSRLERSDAGPGTPTTITPAQLPGPSLKAQIHGVLLLETVSSDAAGTVLDTTAYELTAIRVGRMVALLETDARVAGPPVTLTPFPAAQRVRLIRLLVGRMRREQR